MKPIDLTEFLKIALWTSYIVPEEGVKQVSVMTVAKVESGKTSLLEQFSCNSGILYTTNLTEYGLLHHHREELLRGEFKHIIIPDFIKTLNQKRDTVNTLITFLNAYIEEGVSSISTYAYNLKLEKPIHGGIITSVAIEDFNRMKKQMAAVGFLSRLIILSYSYSQDHIQEIFRNMSQLKGEWSRIVCAFPKEPIKVNIPADLAETMIPAAQSIGARYQAFGFRAYKNFMALSKALALSEGRDIVNKSDTDRILQLADDYMGYSYKPIGPDGTVAKLNPIPEIKQSNNGHKKPVKAKSAV